MARTLRVLGLCGSLRARSYNKMLLLAARDLAPEGMTIEPFDRLRDLPLYDEDVDAGGAPEPVAALRSAIANHDALLIASPEYNYAFSGVLKNAIDWASRPFRTTPLRGKPAAIVSCSQGLFGGVRGQMALRPVLHGLEVLVLPKPEIVVPRAQEKFDAEGRLTDEPTRTLLGAQLVALATWVGRFS